MKRVNILKLFLLSAATLLSSVYVIAQDDDEGGYGIEEVIVTVERRQTSLQDYAGTAVSISAEELDMGGIINIADLAENVPGLDIGQSGGNLEVWVRGIGSSNNTELGDPAAAFHFNGVYIPRPSGIGSAFFDIARVEVNVGPQGTLRGRNAMAGSINAITWDPWLDNYVADIELEVGTYGQKVFRGVVNVPVGDSFAARLAVYKMDHDSYFKDVSEKNLGVSEREDNFGTRLTFLYEPNDDLRVLFSADYLLEEGSGWTGSNYANLLGNNIDPQSIENPRTVYARGFEPELYNPHWGIKFQVNYELGFANLEYMFGHRDLLANYRAATPLTPDYPGVRGNLAPMGQALDNWSFYQSSTGSVSNIHELRLLSPPDQTVSYTIGLFYFEEDQHSFLASTGDRATYFQGYEFNQPNTDSDSVSIYSDLTWNITDSTRLTAGLRFSDDHKERQGVNASYRFCFGAEDANGNTGVCQGARVGSPGFEFAGLDRTIYNPDTNGDGEVNDDEYLAFYFDGIKSFGGTDTVDTMIRSLFGSDATGVVECPDVDVNDEIYTPINGNCAPGSYIIGTDPETGINNSITEQNGEVDDTFIDWRLRLEHDIDDDFLTYGLIATGHKSGGFNDNFPGLDRPVSYGTEEVTLYELGFKNTFDVGSIPTQLNGSLFYNDYTNQVFCNVVTVEQAIDIANAGSTTNEDPPTASLGVNFCFNAADSSIKGGQLDGKFFFPWNLTLTWTYLYLDATIDQADPIQDSRYQADIDPLNARFIDISGNRLPRTAENQFNFSLGQSLDLGVGSFDYLLSVGYRDDHFLSIYNSLDYSKNFQDTGIVEPRLDDLVEGYWTVDLGIGYNHGDSKLRLEGYVNNLTDVVQPTAMLIVQDGNTRFFTRPKIYGFRIKWGL
jgi:iron complex outermembrane receptor protein